MPARVVDSYALIAFFRDEAGAAVVENLLVAASKKDAPLLMTDVTYAEVKSWIVRTAGLEAWDEAAKVLEGLPIEMHPTSRSLAEAAGELMSRHSLRLAGAFAAALAKEKKAELITGDPEFGALEKDLRISWIDGR
jgi:predicted nucleic acid-binding protein